MINKINDFDKSKAKKTLDTLIEEGSAQIFASVLAGIDGYLNLRLMKPEQPFVLAIIEPNDRVARTISSHFNTFASEQLRKRTDLIKTYCYSDIGIFTEEIEERLKQGILFDAVYIRSNLLDQRVKKEIQEMNYAVGEAVKEYPVVNIFTERDLISAVQKLEEIKSQSRRPLNLLLVSHEAYSIMGRVGMEHFRKVSIGNSAVFNPSYISKEDLKKRLTDGTIKELSPEVVIFNLVCSKQPLGHKMKLPLLEELIRVCPSALYIAMVNGQQHYQMIRGNYRKKYNKLRGLVDGEDAFRLYRLPKEKRVLSTTNRTEYNDYFSLLSEEHISHIKPRWENRPVVLSSHPIATIRATKERDIGYLTEKIGSDKVKTNVDMRNSTTIKIGGKAQVVVYPKSLNDLKTIVKVCSERDISKWVLGHGSNLALAEEIPGVVIATRYMNKCKVDADKGIIRAQCGTPLYGNKGLVNVAYNHSLSGLEFARDIPAWVGGLVAANASYRMSTGTEMSTGSIIKIVKALDPQGNEVELTPDQLGFSYKDSRFQKDFWDWIIYEVEFQLEQGSRGEIEDRMEQMRIDRFSIRGQPYYPEKPSAGSVYRLRDAGYIVSGATYTAAELISWTGCLEWNKKDSPLKLDETCPNFIINYEVGKATLAHLDEVMRFINHRVYSEKGVHLQQEIRVKPDQLLGLIK